MQEGTQKPLVFDLKEFEPWMVKTTGMVWIAPRFKQIVVGRLETQKCRLSPQLVCVEPAQLPLEGILVARGLSRVFAKEQASQLREATAPVTSCDDQLRGRQGCVHVMVVNFSHEEIVLPKGTVLGVAEETSASILAAINEEGTSNFRSTWEEHRKVNMVVNDTSFKQYLQDKLGHLSQAEVSYGTYFNKVPTHFS